jgi:hypothetical protein
MVSAQLIFPLRRTIRRRRAHLISCGIGPKPTSESRAIRWAPITFLVFRKPSENSFPAASASSGFAIR